MFGAKIQNAYFDKLLGFRLNSKKCVGHQHDTPDLDCISFIYIEVLLKYPISPNPDILYNTRTDIFIIYFNLGNLKLKLSFSFVT